MNTGRVLSQIHKKLARGGRCYWVLLDPDDFSPAEGGKIAAEAQKAGVDTLLIGGSLLHSHCFDDFVKAVKSAVSVPVVIFPGDATQLSRFADAVLFLSLISGRNPVNLIGEHVKAAPIIKQYGIEAIPTAYMLVESGTVTSVEFMSNTRPLPANKPKIAAAHALAAQYMGMSLVYLEAGSGAPQPVPDAMIGVVREQIDIPLIVGGGIRDVETAERKIKAGADIIVTGNLLQRPNGVKVMREIASLVKRAAWSGKGRSRA
jgi:phosphoglycerol geranylgeranyltransferase